MCRLFVVCIVFSCFSLLQQGASRGQTTGTLTEVSIGRVVMADANYDLAVISGAKSDIITDIKTDSAEVGVSDSLNDGISTATLSLDSKAMRVYASPLPIALADHTTSGGISSAATNLGAIGPVGFANANQIANAAYSVGASTASGDTSVIRGTVSVSNVPGKFGFGTSTARVGGSVVSYSGITGFGSAIGSVQAFIDGNGVQQYIIELNVGGTGKSFEFVERTANANTCWVKTASTAATGYSAPANKSESDINGTSTLASCYVESYNASPSSVSSSIGLSVDTTPLNGPDSFRAVTDDLDAEGLSSTNTTVDDIIAYFGYNP